MGKRAVKVYLSDELYRKIKEHCRKGGLSISSFISFILQMYFSGGLYRGGSPASHTWSQNGPMVVRETTAVIQQREVVLPARGYGDAKTHAELMAELKEALKKRKVKLEE